MGGLKDMVTDTDGIANLESWLVEFGGSWVAASVRELDAEVMTTPVLLDDTSSELSYSIVKVLVTLVLFLVSR